MDDALVKNSSVGLKGAVRLSDISTGAVFPHKKNPEHKNKPNLWLSDNHIQIVDPPLPLSNSASRLSVSSRSDDEVELW